MVSPKSHPRCIAFLLMVSFFSLAAAQALPEADQGGAKKPQVVAPAGVSAPEFVEQAGQGRAAAKPSRLLPSLIGLAVAGAVAAVLVLTVFKKSGYNPHIIPAGIRRGDQQFLFSAQGRASHELLGQRGREPLLLKRYVHGEQQNGHGRPLPGGP